MRITKYEHACLDIQHNDTRIVIDPGVFTKSLTNLGNIDAVIITHIHGDHFDPSIINKIIAKNPDLKIWTTNEVAKELGDKATVVRLQNVEKIGSISLEFFGEDHAEIDPKTPLIQNIGVLVNNTLYYPGDSFTECPIPFEVLAVPASAPWLRVGQTIPLIENSQCKRVFPTHNALLSDIGHSTTNSWLQKFAERDNKEFKYLKPGDSIEV